MPTFNPYFNFMQPPDPQKILMDRLMQLFGQYYKSGDYGKAAAMMSPQSSGPYRAYSSQVLNKIAQQYFGGDTRAAQDFINTEHYTNSANPTGSQQYSYDYGSGSLVDQKGNVISGSWNNPLGTTYQPGGMGQNGYQRGGTQWPGMPGMGGAPGQPGAGGTNPYEGMTTLYRDNTGMIHDPGDNPITSPTAPGNVYNFWGMNQGNSRGNRSWGSRGQNRGAANPYGPNAIQKPGLNSGNITANRNPVSSPVAPTTPNTVTQQPPPQQNTGLEQGNPWLTYGQQ